MYLDGCEKNERTNKNNNNNNKEQSKMKEKWFKLLKFSEAATIATNPIL